MNMQKFMELIPSKTMRNFLTGMGHEFTDAEQATIIYNSGLTLKKRDALLWEIASQTSDVVLQKQIEDRIALDKSELRKLLKETKDVIFKLEGCFSRLDAEYGPGEYGYFSRPESAKQTAMQSGKKFELKIIHIFSEPMVLSAIQGASAAGGISYNEEGEVLGYWTQEANDIFNAAGEHRVYGTSFEDRYIELPHPFVYGSQVCIAGDTEVFTVRGFRSKEEEKKRMEWLLKNTGVSSLQECLDYIDTALPLYIRTECGEEEHCHVSPLFLEFAGSE